MGISFGDVGDYITGSVTFGQCDSSGCGSGHRGSGVFADGYNQLTGNSSQSNSAGGALNLDWSSLSLGNKKLIIYAGLGVGGYVIIKISYDLLHKIF